MYDLEEIAKELGVECANKPVWKIKEEIYQKLDSLYARQRKQERFRASLEECGLDVWEKTPCVDLPENLKRLFTSFMKSNLLFLILQGNVGTLKTRYLIRMSKMIYGNLIKKLGGAFPGPEQIFFLSWVRFLTELELGREHGLWREMLERAGQSRVLFIDDFYSGYTGTSYRTGLSFLLIDQRYANGKKTIISTNVDLHKLRKESSGDQLRILDRVLDKNLSLVYTIKGGSQRCDAEETISDFPQML